MAEILAITGGIASFAQLLDYAATAGKAIKGFCDDLGNAPSELYRIRDKIVLLHSSLEELQQHLGSFDDEVLLPLDFRLLVGKAIQSVWDPLIGLQHQVPISEKSNAESLKKRLRWALKERDATDKLLERLRDVETTLTYILHLLSLRISVLTNISVRQSICGLDALRALLEMSPVPQAGAVNNHHRQVNPLRSCPWSCVLRADSWLRKLGFYGSVTAIATVDKTRKTRVYCGYKSPLWMLRKDVCLEVEFARLETCWSEIHICPGYIRVQNQVSANAPLMGACKQGNIGLIQQYLREGNGSVRDRAICSGKTPLLFAIEGGHLDAVKCLLEAGADPNIGDDERVLPVFAALGFKRYRNTPFAQYPPSTDGWIYLLQMLVQYGASVHEVVGNKKLAMLNITNSTYAPKTCANFFRLLHSECYMDFDIVDNSGWSALLNAIRTENGAIEALNVLANAGVNMSREFPDGRTALHLAAEMSKNHEVLEYIYNSYKLQDVNRQDKWGLTPLHYSVFSRSNRCKHDCRKVLFLLERGANPELRGATRWLVGRMNNTERTPYEISCELGPEVRVRFLEALRETGHLIPEEFEEDVFYDAMEQIA